ARGRSPRHGARGRPGRWRRDARGRPASRRRYDGGRAKSSPSVRRGRPLVSCWRLLYENRMAIRIESPQGEAALTDFILFQDRVYQSRSVRWPPLVPLLLPALEGHGPFAQERTVRPFLAVEGDRPLARAVAMIDRRYQRHWREPLGHVVMFEALPE